ncbi:alkaline protease [Myriangium duriaei CBS 260.36]|uniref:Alkaline protease n=1 Tax=Myriangium duriaei CBS 260.36 TaxID=1168546 RepID=A0A9P4MJS1_9PEZI|nr:alkaline protease [Myriangium duriaei CBS 260.36]
MQRFAPYNLHRISHRGFSDTSTYWYVRPAGVGTYAYVLDGGIDSDHAEFGGRVTMGFNAFGDYPPTDQEGHGTYIAGIIGGKKYGVAKKTNLISVKVLHHGHTTLDLVLLGYQFAVDDILSKGRVEKSVINLSVAGEFLGPLNQAVDEAHAKGITTVVPAGNGNKNAYTVSPAASKGSITVGATDRERVRPGFCNWGPAVQIFAPGYKVCSSWTGGGHRKTRTGTGTAAASAHVAGLVVYFKSFKHLPNAETTWSFIHNVATRGVVKNAAGSSDLFAYNLSGR